VYSGVSDVVHGAQEACAEFGRLREQSSTPSARERQLRDLAMAYDSFVDLKNNVEEGSQVCRVTRPE